ncbi:MAG: hypothetical protein K8T10_16195 [Candidatus Eremiobacteraeota bacterium]|nr:hypothetical protein [Candidatus Eremiobacteraeota bacterium]
MNMQPGMMPDNIPPGIYEYIIQPMLEKKESMKAGGAESAKLMEVMKRVEFLEGKIAQMNRDAKTSSAQFSAPGAIADAAGEDAVMKENLPINNLNLPPFIQQGFQDDFRQKPAESVVGLMSEMYQKKPDTFKGGGKSMADMMGIFQNISNQARKDRLIEKNRDAGEMIKDIEQIFKDIPEIKNRADAYEIAYKLVKGTLTESGGEHQVLKRSQHKKKFGGKGEEEDPEKSGGLQARKKRAFVEGKKTSSMDRNGTELTDMEKMVCRKLGISEEKFSKYRRQ